MLLLPMPIAPPTPAKAPSLPAPRMSQPKAERRRHLLRYVLAGAQTSHTRAAAWVRAHGADAVLRLAWRESNWGETGEHAGPSSAFGIFGFLNQTWKDVGVRKSENIHAQVEGMFRYTDNRFSGDFRKALAFHRKHRYW